MKELGWTVRADLPAQWVVDCQPVGKGDQALTYLGRYLYRGVLPEKNIRRNADGQVTFRYTDNTGTHKTRTLAGADFPITAHLRSAARPAAASLEAAM